MSLAARLAEAPSIVDMDDDAAPVTTEDERLLARILPHVGERCVFDAAFRATAILDPTFEVRRIAKALQCNTIADLTGRWENASPARRREAIERAIRRLETT